MQQAGEHHEIEKLTTPSDVPATIPEAPEEEGEAPDDTGIDQKDIDLIIQNVFISLFLYFFNRVVVVELKLLKH